jgi:hypothetical protein
MVTERTIDWRLVPLGEGWDSQDQDLVVWVDIKKLDQSWRNDPGYVGANGAGSDMPGRYEEAGKWLAEFVNGHRPVFMPTVCLNDAGDITFTDGRHRVAWLRDHGAIALPVGVPPDEAATIETRFGTRQRKTILVAE